MFKLSSIKTACASAIALFSVNAMAADPRIMSDRQNECAIYLCLPQGFEPVDCKPALRAYIERTSKLTRKGKRIYTDLPDMSYCIEPIPDDLAKQIEELQQPTSQVSYDGGYEVHMPDINKCTRWASKQYSANHTVTYCAAISTTPAYVFISKEPKHPYETINVGDTSYTQGMAPVRQFTEVLVDGKLTGERYYK